MSLGGFLNLEGFQVRTLARSLLDLHPQGPFVHGRHHLLVGRALPRQVPHRALPVCVQLLARLCARGPEYRVTS